MSAEAMLGALERAGERNQRWSKRAGGDPANLREGTRLSFSSCCFIQEGGEDRQGD